LEVSVSNLLIERDIYYRAESVGNDGTSMGDHDYEVDTHIRLRESLSDPTEWGNLYERYRRAAEFAALTDEEYFVMGDNSPRSQDSRLWPNSVRHAENRHAVNRRSLIGKAFFIYWPHGVPFLNSGKGFLVWPHRIAGQHLNPQDQAEARSYARYSFPFYPQWWRWKRIR
jgi:signal peptidase I